MSEEHVVIPEVLKQNQEALAQEMERIARDAAVLEAAIREQQRISQLSAQDLLDTIG